MQKDVNVYSGDNIRSITITPVGDSKNVFEAKIVVEHDDILTTYEIPRLQFNENCSVGINKKTTSEEIKNKSNSILKKYFQRCEAKLNINISALMLAMIDEHNYDSYGTVTDDYSKLYKRIKDNGNINKSNLNLNS